MLKVAPALCLVLACGNGSSTRVEQQPAAAPALAPEHPPPLEAPVADGAWSYEMLSPDERAVIDRGREEAAGWDRVQRGFADAVRAQAATAPTEAGAR